MNPILSSFLQGQTAVDAAYATWEWRGMTLPLQQRTYLGSALPPDQLISSARAVCFRGQEVMVLRDHKDNPYIIPGGRREPGESVLEALKREVQEETGWTLQDTAVLGFVHFVHERPIPAGYPYPHPDFFWAVFTGQAVRFDPTALKADPYVTSSGFQLIDTVLTMPLGNCQYQLLRAALHTNQK